MTSRPDLGGISGSRASTEPCGLGPPGFDPGREGPWTTDYIDNAATAREPIYRRDGTLFCDDASNYEIPDNGIHLCGQTDDGEQPTTVASYPMRPDEARAMWLLAKEAAECGEGEDDFIVDLCIDDSIEEDFRSNRQLWPRAIAAWNAASAGEAGTAETVQQGSVHEHATRQEDAHD